MSTVLPPDEAASTTSRQVPWGQVAGSNEKHVRCNVASFIHSPHSPHCSLLWVDLYVYLFWWCNKVARATQLQTDVVLSIEDRTVWLSVRVSVSWAHVIGTRTARARPRPAQSEGQAFKPKLVLWLLIVLLMNKSKWHCNSCTKHHSSLVLL